MESKPRLRIPLNRISRAGEKDNSIDATAFTKMGASRQKETLDARDRFNRSTFFSVIQAKRSFFLFFLGLIYPITCPLGAMVNKGTRFSFPSPVPPLRTAADNGKASCS